MRLLGSHDRSVGPDDVPENRPTLACLQFEDSEWLAPSTFLLELQL